MASILAHRWLRAAIEPLNCVGHQLWGSAISTRLGKLLLNRMAAVTRTDRLEAGTMARSRGGGGYGDRGSSLGDFTAEFGGKVVELSSTRIRHAGSGSCSS